MSTDQLCGRVARLGLTALKGAAHEHPASLEVRTHGSVGDRAWCVVERDPHRSREAVARTVRTPELLRVRAQRRPEGGLRLRLPHATFAVPEPGDEPEPLVADYWGRPAPITPAPGPWDAALSELVGRPVGLARVRRPGAVVYAEPVVLLTTSSLRELGRRAGAVVDDERFRSPVLVDTGDAPPFVEDGWHGRVLRIGGPGGTGGVELAVTAGVARCAVVRLTPGTGERAGDDPLRLLAPERLVDGPGGREVAFGVGAHVRVPGTVRLGDAVTLTGT